MNWTRCCISILAALLLFPAAAFADGTYEFQSDQSHVLAHAKTSDGKGAYYFVFTFPSAVSAATMSQGQCQLSFGGDPKTVECTVPREPTGALGTHADVMFVLGTALPCADTIPLRSSIDNQTYRDDGTLSLIAGGCPAPLPQPPAPPTPEPTPTPTPDQQPAGGAVAKPHNPIVVGAGPGGGPHVRLFEPPAMTSFFQFDAFGSAFTGGVFVAAGDVNGDGLTDVITTPGPGGGPNVKVFDGKTGSLVQSFFAYDPSFSGGIFVAAGDVNGDGKADIVTGAGPGGGPHVKVFSGADGSELRSFFAFDPGFSGGVRVAAGDVNGDGKADIITAAGPGGGPHVKIFDGTTGSLLQSFFAFAPTFTGGVFVAAGDVNGDGFADVVAGSGGSPQVKVLNGKTSATLASFFAYAPSFTGGVRVAAGDVNGDGFADVLTGPGAGMAPNVRAFDGATSAQLNSFNAFDAGFTGGVFIGAASEPFGASSPGSKLILIRNIVGVNTSCPVSVQVGFCDGSVRLFLPAVQRLGKSAAKSKPKKPILLGSKKFRIAAGKRLKVKVALSKRSLKRLGRAKKVKAFVEVTTHDAGGNASTRKSSVVLTRR